ncbi:MAG TPA: hypothetical protein VLX12_10285 [Syntrophorhabdales bacterium]|nr:hypothetical protein [Syntrophorhabdales bacterium]
MSEAIGNMLSDPSAGLYPRLVFIVDGRFVARFCLLLQQGVKIRRRVGCSVDVFLRKEIEAAPETIEKIQSIMLDGKPVDDIRSSLLLDGSTLALSAAMPGLVGATLRRGGAYSSFRSTITYHQAGKACAPGMGWVSVKIFNLLMIELGPDLLRTGVLLKSSDLLGFLMERADEFRQGCIATLDDKPIDIGMLEGSTALAGNDQVFLTVTVGPTNV